MRVSLSGSDRALLQIEQEAARPLYVCVNFDLAIICSEQQARDLRDALVAALGEAG